MKRQKIKRYRFSVTQNTRRKKSPEPLKSAGVVLVCLCLIAGAAFGVHKMIRSKAVGWQGEDLHRYFVSPATGTRVQGLYEINHSLYYFGSNHFLKTGWLTLDGVEYCFDETGHPRTGTYQEDGKTWELDSDGRVKGRLNGWKKVEGILKYYDETGAPAQGWIQLEGKDYFFVDGISQAGWVETDAGTHYLDGNGNQMTGWCVIDGQPYAFDAGGELKQGWDHSHEKSYYFINGISQAGMFREGTLSSDLNGSGSVQPGGNAAPEEDLAEDAEGEPPEEELLEEQPAQTETEDGQTTPATEQQTQPAEEPAAAQEIIPETPAEMETPAQEQAERTENA